MGSQERVTSGLRKSSSDPFRDDWSVMLEAAEDGRENLLMADFGERIFSEGLKERLLWGDLGEPSKGRVVLEGVRRSGMLMGGMGMSGRRKSG